jgi:hypothetical protein
MLTLTMKLATIRKKKKRIWAANTKAVLAGMKPESGKPRPIES